MWRTLQHAVSAFMPTSPRQRHECRCCTLKRAPHLLQWSNVRMSDARQVPAPTATASPTRVRHVVLGVTVAVYMITYMDRSLMSTALPAIRQDLGISLLTASSFITAFRLSYSLFQIPGAWLGDKIGPRRALTLIVGWWSAFTALTGL